MKKWMMLASLALAGIGGAQSWDVSFWSTPLGKVTLVGCYGKQDGIYCDLSFVLTKQQTANFYWSARSWKAYTQSGTAITANKVAFIDGEFNSDSNRQDVIANVPLKVQIYFNTPSNISSFRALSYSDVKFDNIPVRPYGAAASVPATTPTSDGWTPVTNPPFPTNFNVGNFKGSFSKCQVQGATYICGAILNRK